jgi:hypothetical protein
MDTKQTTDWTAHEKAADEVEGTFPLLMCAAFAEAAAQARAAGLDIMEIEDDKLFRVSSDGTRTFIKEVGPCIQVESGSKLPLRQCP